MYRTIDKPSYTRREYITGIPGSKIAQHNMGDLSSEPDDYPVQISLRVEEEVLRTFPHQVIRENKQATGAGADRVSDGMRQAFGKPVGTAARLSADTVVFTAYCDVDQAPAVKEAFRRAYNKLSPPCRITVERGEKLLVA
jgi:large subunit ribosomal protein L10e